MHKGSCTNDIWPPRDSFSSLVGSAGQGPEEPDLRRDRGHEVETFDFCEVHEYGENKYGGSSSTKHISEGF